MLRLLQIPFSEAAQDEENTSKLFENLDFSWTNLLIILLLFGVFQVIIWFTNV